MNSSANSYWGHIDAYPESFQMIWSYISLLLPLHDVKYGSSKSGGGWITGGISDDLGGLIPLVFSPVPGGLKVTGTNGHSAQASLTAQYGLSGLYTEYLYLRGALMGIDIKLET